MARRAALLVVVLAGAVSCRRDAPPATQESIETVDVGEGVDSNIRPEEDERAVVRARGLLGVLPGDFPSDFWVYEPASIVDFGAGEGGRSFVALRAVASPAEVSRRFQSEERSRGWEVTAAASTLLTFAKSGRRIEAELEQRGNETWIRIEYPPG